MWQRSMRSHIWYISGVWQDGESGAARPPLAMFSRICAAWCALQAPTRRRLHASLVIAGTATSASVAGAHVSNSGSSPRFSGEPGAQLSNFSGMHHATPATLYTPSTVTELQALVSWCHDRGVPLRPVGRFLSPNGVAACGTGASMVSLASLDQVLDVDVDNMEVTVQSGALVGDVVATLAKHGLTLSNFSSISDQRVAGWIQVAAHGTGAGLSTVDGMVKRMKIVTPALGTIEVAATGPTAGLFRMAVVGLGCLGVVAELTLSCVPAHDLREQTTVETHDEVSAQHAQRLRNHRHVRYHWFPHTDATVVTVADEVPATEVRPATCAKSAQEDVAAVDATQPMKELLQRVVMARNTSHHHKTVVNLDDMRGMSFASMRDVLLDIDPFHVDHVAAVSRAEVEYWRRSQGVRIGPSPDILGFDCGGQQLVLEVCLPAGTSKLPNGAGIAFVRELLDTISAKRLPAHSPIEQRWTSRSRAYMSPAFSEDPADIFSWIGVITYLPPSHDDASRERLQQQFNTLVEEVDALSEKYVASAVVVAPSRAVITT